MAGVIGVIVIGVIVFRYVVSSKYWQKIQINCRSAI